jgi:flagellum-specific peptidoglycan hydrolase FlgJ
MNWNFFKKNWFYLAMGVVMFLYATRKYPHLNPLNAALKYVQTAQDNADKRASKKGAALLGIVPDHPKDRSPEIADLDAAKTEAFLKRFAKVARSECKQFGVPTSVILASAFVNSKSGLLESATTGNNYFALPCTDNWEGETIQIKGNCLRKYESAWASFRDFSIYLSSQEWYGSTKKNAGKDWHQWAKKLDKEGVSDAKAMGKVIEAYQLEELDSN